MRWVLDCGDCCRLGTVVFSQDVDTGRLVSDDGARADEQSCPECGSEWLIPMVAGEADRFRPIAAIFAAA